MGMITEYHRYILVNLDASLLDLSHFKNINKNITWFSLQNTISVNQRVSFFFSLLIYSNQKESISASLNY